MRAFADPPLVDDAAEFLAAAPLHAIAYCFTGSSYVRGAVDDWLLLKSRLESARAAFRWSLPQRRRSPHFLHLAFSGSRSLVRRGSPRSLILSKARGTLRARAFEVIYSGPVGLPPDQQAIQPVELYDWIRTRVPERAEAVFIGGNGLRAVGVIKALEEALNRPVLTANQVAFWQALVLMGSDARIVDYGQVFSVKRLRRGW